MNYTQDKRNKNVVPMLITPRAHNGREYQNTLYTLCNTSSELRDFPSCTREDLISLQAMKGKMLFMIDST